MNYYLGVLKKYAVFSGRAQRAEFWYFTLFNALIGVAINFIDILVITISIPLGLSILYMLAVFIPGIAVSVRRLHDTNKSGWYLLIGLIPIIGSIVLIIFFIIDSDPTENQYGPNPKGTMIS